MKPKLVDLICLRDGSWELCRVYAWEQDSCNEDETEILRLPLELNADGTWTLSGLNKRKLLAVFGNDEKNIPEVMLRYINGLLHELFEEGFLHDGLWPKDANPKQIVSKDCFALDEMKASIADFVHALSESDANLLERIDEASPTSIAGLLRDAGESDLAYRFLQDCPENLLPLAEIPLVSLNDAIDGDECGFSFLHAIGNIDWTGESSLGNAAEKLDVHVERGGAAEIRVAEWMLFGRRFRSVAPMHNWFEQNEIYIFNELNDLPGKIDALVRKLSSAGWKHLIEQGQTPEPRERLVAPVSHIVHQQLAPHLQQLARIAGERIYPFDNISRPVAYSRFFAGPLDPQTRARRVQARLSTPLLAECIATGRFPGAARAIDNGEALVETLATTIGVPHWVIARLAKLPEMGTHQNDLNAELELLDPRDLAKIATVMATLGPDSPATRPEAQASELGIWINAARIDRIMDGSHVNFGRDFFGHATNDTQLMIRAIGRESASAIDANSEASDESSGRSISEVANETARISLYYCIARESIRHHLQFDHDDRADVERTLAVWLLRQGATELLECARRASSLMQMYCEDIMSRMLLTALSESTHSLLDAHACDETGVEIVPLASKAALEEEGGLMHHCVGGYWGRAANHQVELFSLHDPNSKHRATLCLAKGEDDRWQIEEFKLARNAKVANERLLRAAEALCLRLDDASHAQSVAATENLSFARHDRRNFALQLLPPIAMGPLLDCFPGVGELESRIEHAITMAERFRQRSVRGRRPSACPQASPP